MDRQQIDQLWFSFQDIPGVALKLNDSVRITTGKHAGAYASVIALIAREPEPIYLIEHGATGQDLELPESALSPAEE
ncbi:MAG TPA: hypothetical protein VFS21_30385 [Roseiflexaceae bacterium]|nr:hypothetical protein [Roseiflexaceae bacterium]